ncbi:RNA polymerase sigma factor RpoD [Bacteroidia bacterium]|nr:RNA polymerase sigma factor RpoD [Bacteroidia bacterium]
MANCDSAALACYLKEIGKIKAITPEEEFVIAQKVRNGDKQALLELIRCNLKFVVSVARQYQYRGLCFEDLINEGNMGLLKATGRFDETKGFKFISYAVWWIRQSILEAIYKNARLIRIPQNRILLFKQIDRCYQNLEQEKQRTPTHEEIGDELKLKTSTVTENCMAALKPYYLDAPIAYNDDQKLSLEDMYVSDEGLATEQETHSLNDARTTDINRFLYILDERERFVIVMFYGLGINVPTDCATIAEDLHTGSERVRQIKAKALKKLRQCNNIDFLKRYL